MAKEWTVEHAGHRIRVVNESKREYLEIDGEVVDSREGFLATQSLLIGPLRVGERVVPVEARIGSALGPVCHILVDGDLVGGDTQKQLPNFSDGSEAEAGKLAFIRKTIIRQGLPFGTIMLLAGQGGDTLLSKAIAGVFFVIGFGGLMGMFGWRGVVQAADKRRQRLAAVVELARGPAEPR